MFNIMQFSYRWYDSNLAIGRNEIQTLKYTQKFLIDNKMQQTEVNMEDLIFS